MKKYLVTGAAGFIGFHTTKKLLECGHMVVGVDNINDYYDQNIKLDRLSNLENYSSDNSGNFLFHKMDIANAISVNKICEEYKFDVVINLAAQAGVRYSIENPHSYVESNLVGFTNILEACRNTKVGHLVYASTSSVYGANVKLPFSEHDPVDHPLQFYAATKRANELMAHAYSNLYKLPTTGLRFFTVYGPWGRPDMALFKFTKNIIEDKAIPLFNGGQHIRDFTYVDDIVDGILKLAVRPPAASDSESNLSSPNLSTAPYQIFNIGNGETVPLLDYVKEIERSLGKTAKKELLPMQAGDVKDTHCDVRELENHIGYRDRTSVAVGVKRFVEWYSSYYGISND